MSWRWSFSFPLQVAWQELLVLLLVLGWMWVDDGVGRGCQPAAAWREWSWGHRICSSLPGEGCLWAVAVELAGAKGTLLCVPERLLSWLWEWQVLRPLPGSKAKVQLFQLLEGKGRGALACGAALSPSLLAALGTHMSPALAAIIL